MIGVTTGKKYYHLQTGKVMYVDSAEHLVVVRLSDRGNTTHHGFREIWEGSWEKFHEEWAEY